MALIDVTQQQEFNQRDVRDRELLTALASLDRLLGRAVMRARADYGACAEADIYRGLYVTDEQVDQLLVRGPSIASLTNESTDEINLPEEL
ncbi:MAG TPA: hypothetical protein VE863_19615, partial [Pyrinomonadaceae bacterium]|nr:hypothetical protein [Pyrinomonadaceae bacterium]